MKMLECSKLVERGEKGYDYEYSIIPEYKGKLYIYDMNDPFIKDMVCIIVKDIS